MDSIRYSVHFALMLSACTLVGCGGDMVPVSGRVEFVNGEAPVGAIRVIRFEPANGSTAKVRKVASSDLSKDGDFSLMTYKPGDGVFRGDYIVTFTVIESPRTGKSLIPEQYSFVGTSPFEVTVDSAKSDYLFRLESLD